MFIECLENNSYKVNTKGGLYYSTTFDANLDVFAATSRFMSENALKILFDRAYYENKKLLAANILYNLDIRNGKGERRIFKIFFKLMCVKDYELAVKILKLIPSLGRYDYIFESYQTPVWQDCIQLIQNQLKEDLNSDHPSLLGKWMPSLRTHNKNNVFAKRLAAILGYSEKEYRRMLASLRSKIDVVEKKMSSKKFSEIDFENVPAKALKQYTSTFFKHDEERFNSYLEMVKNGKRKINTKGLAPNELVKALFLHNMSENVIDELWEKQENYFDSLNSNVLIMADTSVSMYGFNAIPISSAIGLAIYAAQRNKGIFHNKFLNFSDMPTFQVLHGSKLSKIIANLDYSNWDNSTNIDRAMKLVLKAMKKSKNQEECPSHLVIISDMEFDSSNPTKPNFKYWQEQFKALGLEMPKIVFWNVAGNIEGIPVTKNEKDVILVSGFSQTIFKSIFKIKDYNPVSAMQEILKPYLDLL